MSRWLIRLQTGIWIFASPIIEYESGPLCTHSILAPRPSSQNPGVSDLSQRDGRLLGSTFFLILSFFFSVCLFFLLLQVFFSFLSLQVFFLFALILFFHNGANLCLYNSVISVNYKTKMWGNHYLFLWSLLPPHPLSKLTIFLKLHTTVLAAILYTFMTQRKLHPSINELAIILVCIACSRLLAGSCSLTSRLNWGDRSFFSPFVHRRTEMAHPVPTKMPSLQV